MKLFRVVFLSCLFGFIYFPKESEAKINYRKEFKQLSSPEKRWVIFHPFIARETYRLTLQAREAAKEMAKNSLLDGDENGGQVDAFRHAYWMALLSQNICWKKARHLGKAHEKGNYKDYKEHKMEEGALPDSMSSVMDLFNNEKGIEIGRKNKMLAHDGLINAVRDSVVGGKMKIIRKSKSLEPLDCDGNKINMNEYQHQWNIPKCLVESDFKHQD